MSERVGDRLAHLRVTVDAAGVERSYVQAPWKLFGPVHAPNRPPTLYLTNSTAGILCGDRLTAAFQVRPGAIIRVMSPSATRVHTMMPGQSAAQRVAFHLGEGAGLAYWPNQVIPFAGSVFTQETSFHLQPGATAVAADLAAPGRFAFGEAFAFTAFTSRTRFYIDGRLVLADQWALRPDQSPPLRVGMLEGYTHVGSLYFAGGGADPEALVARLEQFPQVLAGVSRPHPLMVVVRVLGRGAEPVATLLGDLAPGLLGL